MFSLNNVTTAMSDLLLDIKRPGDTPEDPQEQVSRYVETGYPRFISLYDGSTYLLHLTGIPNNNQKQEIGSDTITGDLSCTITTINEGLGKPAVEKRNENADLVLDALKKNSVLKDVNARIILPENNLLQLVRVKLDDNIKTPPSAVGSVINCTIQKIGG